MKRNSYYDNHGLSQSELKQYLALNPQNISEEVEEDLWYTEKKSFQLGDAVDILVCPGNTEAFNEMYFCSELVKEQKPSDKALGVLHLAYDIYKESRESTYNECLLSAARELGWNPKWGDEAVVKNLAKFEDYFEDLKKAEGKIVFTQEDKSLVDQLVMAIRTHENTSWLYEGEVNGSKVETHWQLPLYYTFDSKDCKALLDLVLIDEEHKIIYPFDVKTTIEPMANFEKSVRTFRYDIQAAWYTEALRRCYPEYQIMPFGFVVVSKIERVTVPQILYLTVEDMEVAMYGRSPIIYENVEIRSRVPGIIDLLNIYDIYQEKGTNVHHTLLGSDTNCLKVWG